MFVVFEAFDAVCFAGLGVGGDAGVFFEECCLRGVGIGGAQFLQGLIFIGDDFVLGDEIKPG